jgi:hypothetical protein
MEGLARRLAGLAVALMPLAPADTVARNVVLPPAAAVMQAVELPPEAIQAVVQPVVQSDAPQRATEAR